LKLVTIILFSSTLLLESSGFCANQRSQQNSLQLSSSRSDSEENSSSHQTTDRRHFIKVATALTTASAMLPNIASAEVPTALQTAATLKLPPIGLGAWAWGDSLFWGYNPKQDDDLKEVFNYAVSKNLAFFDTAELYGIGRSETLLGNFRKEAGLDGQKVQIATKFAALPFRTKSNDVVKACKNSLKRLNSDGKNEPIDLYQIHFPNAWSNEEYWDGLAQCYEQGLVKAVGVSNYGVDAMRAVHAKLAERGIPLATNQIQLSLLYRFPIDNGLLQACNDLNVKVLSYSPLALGFLTGKYNNENRPSGPRASIAKKLFDGPDEGKAFNDLLLTMKSISANHGGVPLSQVALNWTRVKGTIPIPGARSLKQVKQNVGALEWDLTKDEVAALDLASAKTPAYISPDKSPFPKEDINTKLKMFDS